MKPQETEQKFLETYKTPLIDQPHTDIPIQKLREVTCTVDVQLRMLAAIYAYIIVLNMASLESRLVISLETKISLETQKLASF